MAYTISALTIRTDNTEAGLKQLEEIWRDVSSGSLPILFDSEHRFQEGISPVARYSGYASDETGAYDFSILGVTADFFAQLEAQVSCGLTRKYETCDAQGSLAACTKRAWERVWADQASGAIQRAFTCDYECSIPAAHTSNGQAHCSLYIALKD